MMWMWWQRTPKEGERRGFPLLTEEEMARLMTMLAEHREREQGETTKSPPVR